MNEPLIEIAEVRKSFGKSKILDGVCFEVEAGQGVALWGSNGAGKTTLIRCLLGLINFEGDIFVAGINVKTHGKSARRLIGYVPQELAMYDDFPVIEAARFMASLKRASSHPPLPLGEGRGEGRQTRNLDVAEQSLDNLGLLDHSKKLVRELSGGMKQKLALSLALIDDPPILVLDEPTSNLDSGARRNLLDLLGDLKSSGKTILFISHRPEEVADLADRVLTLEHGRVVSDESQLVLEGRLS
jgi:ABC-type multidrug transport system ATPase subunit